MFDEIRCDLLSTTASIVSQKIFAYVIQSDVDISLDSQMMSDIGLNDKFYEKVLKKCLPSYKSSITNQASKSSGD